jgi:hypothetical protein
MPICPHCKAKINSDKDVKMKRLNNAHSLEVDIIYCANCDAILGVD